VQLQRETHDNQKTDRWIADVDGTMARPRFSPPGGGRPENSWRPDDLVTGAPAAFVRQRLEDALLAGKHGRGAGSGPDNLRAGTQTLGYEWDEISTTDRGRGLVPMSAHHGRASSASWMSGTLFARPGGRTRLTLYKHLERALISTRDIQWAGDSDSNPRRSRHRAVTTDITT